MNITTVSQAERHRDALHNTTGNGLPVAVGAAGGLAAINYVYARADLLPAWFPAGRTLPAIAAGAAAIGVWFAGRKLGGRVGAGLEAASWLSLIGNAAAMTQAMTGTESPAISAMASLSPVGSGGFRDLGVMGL